MPYLMQAGCGGNLVSALARLYKYIAVLGILTRGFFSLGEHMAVLLGCEEMHFPG